VKRRVILHPKARADLREIWLKTAERWSERQAEAYTRGIVAFFDLLAEEPGIARERRDIHPPVRIHPYKSHLIFFRATDDHVEVVRVLHGRSDWRVLFEA
jgi:toxin ParE1/3/4